MPEIKFYRCKTCRKVVSVWDIRAGGCQKCGGKQISPANLTTWEKVVQICKHPRVWEWSDDLNRL